MPYSIVTPSYADDFERCELLVRSVERMVTGDHYILVDPVDLRRFKPLEAYGAKVLDARSLLPDNFKSVPLTRLWRHGSNIIRGWMTQQLRKIAFAANAPTENVLFVDSDVVFVRPFDPDSLTEDGKIPLFTIDWFNQESLVWANQARVLYGLPTRAKSHGYVHPTFWRRSVVSDMIARIEERGGEPWQDQLAIKKTLSEYNLYGIFAEEVRGASESGHYIFNQPLMHLSWGYDLKREMNKFFAERQPESVAMMFHSKDRIPVSAYRERVEWLWA